MQDIAFDIISREIMMSGSGDAGDFSLTDNCSVQNGGILLYSRAAILTNPMIGIGMEQMINSNQTNASFEMNRWQAQARKDGATLATWSGKTNDNGEFITNINISYL